MYLGKNRISSTFLHLFDITNIHEKKVFSFYCLLMYYFIKFLFLDMLDELLGPESESPRTESTPPLKRRATEPVISSKLATTLDKCKISKRDAMHLLMAAAEAFHIDSQNLIINSKSIHEARKKFRKERFVAIKKIAPALFNDLPSTIHWDGKLLSGMSRKEKNDRLAIIVTSEGMEQLLGVPIIPSSTGKSQADSVYNTLIDWSMLKNIEALCCDSTASNTGSINGACTILEQYLAKDLLYFICRHHIYELVLKCTYETKFGKTSGPDVQLFNKFEEFWKSAEKENYETGISDTFVNDALQDVRETVLEFCLNQLKKYQIRRDYKEFAQLAVIFLGGKLENDIIFYTTGAHHHARWMQKAIYSLKMFIFRKKFFSDDKALEIKIRDICIFIIRVYIQAWFIAPSAAEAANQDLSFLKNLYHYKTIDEAISISAVKKFMNHLWYLTPELAALSFFNSQLSKEEKLKMCKALESDCATFTYKKRILANQKNVTAIVKSNINDFICKDSLNFFKRYNIDTSFLSKDPSTWEKERNYIHGLKIVKNLKVVNDVAEREVKLMTEFNNLLTKDDKQTQYLLPVIKDYRSLYPDCNKKTLLKPYD